MEMFTLAMEWRPEPVPLSRFSGNLHQVWTQLQLPSVLDEGGFTPFSLVALMDVSRLRKGWMWHHFIPRFLPGTTRLLLAHHRTFCVVLR